jgi:hypothetical protein
MADENTSETTSTDDSSTKTKAKLPKVDMNVTLSGSSHKKLTDYSEKCGLSVKKCAEKLITMALGKTQPKPPKNAKHTLQWKD